LQKILGPAMKSARRLTNRSPVLHAGKAAVASMLLHTDPEHNKDFAFASCSKIVSHIVKLGNEFFSSVLSEIFYFQSK
jgi:hypothetical protein